MAKKTWIRILLLMIIVVLFSFSDWSFAAEWDSFNWWAFLLDYCLSALSWMRVLFAKLAWTFLTNAWVYGEDLRLDVLLWKCWNMTKNFANFWLWFYFLYIVFTWLLKDWKESITQKLKDNILWLLIAWVWIQASWFLVSVVLDVSTITLSAAGSFPSQVISGSPYIEWALEKSIDAVFDSKWKEISLFSQNSRSSSFIETREIDLDKPADKEWMVDSLLPKANDVSWPLYFIWFSILETNKITSINSSDTNSLKSTIIKLILQWWTTILFSVEMLMLCIFALIRIVYLWMFIVLSPFAVLLWSMEKIWQKIWFLTDLVKELKFSTFFINVFKPTIIVLWFWVAVIFVALMNNVILDYEKKPFDIQWAVIASTENINSNANGSEWDKTYTTTLDNDFLHFTLANTSKTLLAIILSIVTVIMVYLIIKVAVNMWGWENGGKWFLSSKVSKLQNSVWSLVSSIPLVPVAWYDEHWVPQTRFISAWNVFGAWRKNSLLDEKIASYNSKIKDIDNSYNDVIEKWIGGSWWRLTSSEMEKIGKAGYSKVWLSWYNILEEKKKEIVGIKTEGWKWMTLNPRTSANNGFWITEFTKWLNEMAKNPSEVIDKTWTDIVNTWKWLSDNESSRSLKNLFENNPTYIKAYRDLFDIPDSVWTWEWIRDRDISKSG